MATHWYPVQRRDVHACAVLAHGLNNRPSSLRSIAELLASQGASVLLVAFSGHEEGMGKLKSATFEKWAGELRQAFQEARARADQMGVPLYFVGYSLGALVGECVLAGANERDEGALDIRIDRTVLLAPAITPRRHAKLMALAAKLAPGFPIPSLNFSKRYRANRWNRAGAYKALFDAADFLGSAHPARISDIPTLVLIDPRDELVSPVALGHWIKERGLDHWQLELIRERELGLPWRYRHLILDPPSLGHQAWGQICRRILQHLLLDS